MGGRLTPARRRWFPRSLAVTLGLAALAGGCKSGGSAAGTTGDGGPSSAPDETAAAPADSGSAAVALAQPGDARPMLGITAFVAAVYKEPRDTARKLGYLRVGAKVARSAEPAGKSGCPGGWYAIQPRGYVCVGDEATIDLDNPMLKAAEKRPNLKTALPYKYAFVRAVLPMYVRVPTGDEQKKAEFKLQEHLDWFKENKEQVTKVTLGADDVPIDERGVPVPDKKLGEMGLGKNSQEIGLGALLGGNGDDDPIPFWLEGGKRLVPNISEYKIKGFELFADRSRRHSGLALIASFPTGPSFLDRRFAVTTDMRLVPASKIKPDTGSPWHGLELTEQLTLPLAFIRSQGARGYKIVHGKVVPGDTIEHRSAIALSGKMRTVEGVKYYRTLDKRWLSQQDVGLAVPPATWPEEAEKGKKWIEISITNQTLSLWEGKKPVYATLISTGQAGLDDPKKSTATVRGTFKIRNKHISAMMDSNESSAVGGRANTSAVSVSSSSDDDKDDRPAKAPEKAKPKSKSAAKDAKGAKAADKAKPAEKGAKGKSEPGEKVIPHKGDGEYGVTRRRGEGTFQLRDVPYIQYFESGYALHAAYWHDVFGTPRSHGCVNLAPVDAHRIFFWTDPPVPDGWHGVNTSEETGEGTTVIIHE
ncbi:MAG: L,D-transpeptidase [Minicystis sp.]